LYWAIDSVGFLHCIFSEISVLSYRGSTLAEFLTGGDPGGDVKKSVKELQEYDPKAVQLCRRLATHYSKQLFEIYKNKEDPFFLPSWHGLQQIEHIGATSQNPP
jgi:hypothetical protein